MKLMIPKGANINETLDLLKAFLEENAQGYDVLRTNMNVYMTLKSKDGDVCPINDSELLFSEGRIYDYCAEMRRFARKNLTERAIYNVESEIRALERLPKSVEDTWKKYTDAVKKGRKAETIERHKQNLDKLNKQLESAGSKIEYWKNVKSVLEDDIEGVRNILIYDKHPNNKQMRTAYWLKLDADCKVLDKPLYFGNWLSADEERCGCFVLCFNSSKQEIYEPSY